MTAPSITSISPSVLYQDIDTVISIVGTSLTSATSVAIGSLNLAILSNTATLITAQVRAHTLLAGSQTVTVTTAGGSDTDTFTMTRPYKFTTDTAGKFGDMIDVYGRSTQIILTSAGAIPVDTELTISGDVIVQDVVVRGSSDGGTTTQPVHTDTSGDVQVDVLSSALPSGAATEATLLLVESAVDGLEADTATIAGDTTSIDGKTPALGTAAMAASSPVTIATDDTMITALDTAVDSAVTLLGTIDADTSNIATDTSTIAGDTTSLDTKTPALGTAVMTGSSPVTIATNDTMITALDTAVDSAVTLLGTIDTDTSALAGCVGGTEVQVDVVSSALPSGAATETSLAAVKTAVEIMDDWDDTDRCKVNVALNSGVAVDIGGGNAGTGTARVSIATDDVNSAAIKTATEAINAKLVTGTDIGDVTVNNAAGASAVNIQDGGNTITVDGSVTVSATNLDIRDLSSASDSVAAVCTNAGTFAVQAACTATDLDIRDLTSVSDSVTVKSATAADCKVEATIAAAQTLAAVTSITNAVTVSATDLDVRDLTSVSDSVTVKSATAADCKVEATIAASQSVAATQSVAANLNCTEASAAAIKTAVELIDDAISGTEMQVDVVAALPAGSNAIGKLAANSGVDIGDVDILSIAAGDNNIGNVDIASAIPTGTNVIGAVKLDAPNYTVVKKVYTAGTPTDGIVWSPAGGTKWAVTRLIISTDATCLLTLEDDLAAGDSAVLRLSLAANGGAVIDFAKGEFTSGEADADLLVTATAGNIYITAIGYEF